MKRHVDAIVREALNDAIQGGRLRTRSIPSFSVDVPRHTAFGDLACDVALVLGRQLGKSPHAIGAAIAGCVRDPHGWLAEVGIGGPGFVNFRFAPPFWGAVLAEAVAAAGEASDSSDRRSRKTICLCMNASKRLKQKMENRAIRGTVVGPSENRASLDSPIFLQTS